MRAGGRKDFQTRLFFALDSLEIPRRNSKRLKLLLQFNNFTLDPDRRELKGAEGIIHVEPQVFDLLLHLAQNTNRVISKDELIEHVWKGRIVSDAALNSRINFARRALGESGEKQMLIKTVPRRGFLFAAKVTTRTHDPATSPAKVETPIEPSKLTLPDKPSIAVMPFQNMSGDPEQEYFADGVVEDIIAALSRMRWLFVIARNSSFSFKGRAMDAKQVGQELGVRYLLDGSVRKSGNRVRISTQLVDASTGNQIWAERYDAELTDIFDLQDQITAKVVGALGARLMEAEGVRSHSRSAENLGAWDMVTRANFLFWRLTKTDSESAIALLQEAVKHYPDYAPAHAMLAFMLLVSRQVGWRYMEPQVNEAAAHASRAAELDEDDAWAHLALGFVAYTRRRTDEAVNEFQRALDLNPNFAAAHGYLGFALVCDGQSDQAIDHSEQAMRMSPQDPQNALFNVALAAAHYLAGRYNEAIVCGRRAMQQRFGLTNGHRVYIASLAQAGKLDEARAALAKLQELQPENSVAWIERNIPYTPRPMAKFLEGMRKAGLK